MAEDREKLINRTSRNIHLIRRLDDIVSYISYTKEDLQSLDNKERLLKCS